jgi:phage terminase large subunit-like protein
MKLETIEQADEYYRKVLTQAQKDDSAREATAELGKRDLYFLLTRILKRKDIRHPWLFARCKEVQEEPNNCLDLWAREHRKSTIITFALTLQDIIKDSELCICIFSITRPLAKDFLEQIKREAEDNALLKELYPDVFYQDPKKESPKWTMDDGLVFKRKGNPRECTLEAHGFIEGLPTGSHFQIRVYDDMIDQKNCTNPDIMKKVIQQWELSLNLGSDRMVEHYGICNIARYIGTRYHYNDVYGHLITKGAAKSRIYPATDDGKPKGKPVYFSEALLQEKRDMGSYVFSCQMLQDPKADDVSGFDIEDIQSWWPDMIDAHKMNRYIIVDPASSKKKGSDFTTIMVYGLNVDNNVYLLDGRRDRMNLTERTTWLFRFHRKWRPDATGYEKYGQQADIEHIEYVMNEQNYRFTITPLGGQVSKEDRIRGLIPLIEKHRYYVPLKLIYQDYEEQPQDLSKIHIQEFNDFPVGMYDDTIDNTARILDTDLGAEFPELDESLPFGRDVTMAKTEYPLFGD